MNCLHCGKKLPLLRKFKGGEFCSDEHQAQYSAESDRVALRRLIETPGAPMRSVKATPKTKGFKQTLEERTPTPPLHNAMLPLGKWVVHRGPSVLLGTLAELEPMGREVALSYFRGSRPRPGLWLPLTDAEELVEPAAGSTCVLTAEEAAPVFFAAPTRPASGIGIEELDWQALSRELEGEDETSETAPPLAGRLELKQALERSPAPIAFEESPLPEASALAAALPKLQLTTLNPETAQEVAAPVEPSRQRRLRPKMVEPPSAPPVARLVTLAEIPTRPGSLEGKLAHTELPTVLSRRPAWPTRLGLRSAGQELPAADSVELVAFGRAESVLRPWLPALGEPVFSAAPSMPASCGATRELACGHRVGFALRGVAGALVPVETGVLDPLDNPPFLEPPNSVPLRVPSLDPPLSPLRGLALTARNPLNSRRAAMAGELQPAEYEYAPPQMPQIRTLDSASLPGQERPFGDQQIPAAGASRPHPGAIEELMYSSLAPAVSLAVGKPAVYGLGGAQRATRLFRLPATKLLPLDSGRRPKGELEPCPPKGFLILSSSRLKLRKDSESSLVRLRRAMPELPKLGRVPVWGGGAVMALALGFFLFSGAPKAAGNIQPSEPSAWSNLQNAILSRAAVALTDDFRGGLGDWTGRDGWGKSWSFDATGFARTGALALYSPSVGLTDYRFEFLGQIEKKALSWVVRAADLDNYQVVRLELSNGGPIPRGVVVRYPVIAGKKGSVTRTDLPMTVSPDTVYRVAMEIHGSDQTLTVQGQVVDSWTEKRLKRGGIGFFTGAGERARLRWIGVWHQYDALGRLCAYLAPRQTGESQ